MFPSLGSIVDDNVAAEVLEHLALLLAPARPGHTAAVLLCPLQGDVAGAALRRYIYDVNKVLVFLTPRTLFTYSHNLYGD